MKTIKILKANNLQKEIDSFILEDYQLIYAFNKAVKNNEIERYISEHNFRNYKVMELSLMAAKERSMRWFKIMNQISNRYNTIFCCNEVYNEAVKALNINI